MEELRIRVREGFRNWNESHDDIIGMDESVLPRWERVLYLEDDFAIGNVLPAKRREEKEDAGLDYRDGGGGPSGEGFGRQLKVYGTTLDDARGRGRGRGIRGVRRGRGGQGRGRGRGRGRETPPEYQGDFSFPAHHDLVSNDNW